MLFEIKHLGILPIYSESDIDSKTTKQEILLKTSRFCSKRLDSNFAISKYIQTTDDKDILFRNLKFVPRRTTIVLVTKHYTYIFITNQNIKHNSVLDN